VINIKILLERYNNSKTYNFEYVPVGINEDKYIGYAKKMGTFVRPLYTVKSKNKEVCRLEDDNLLRPWLGLLSLIFPSLRARYTLKMGGLGENCFLSYNGSFYFIRIKQNIYAIKGHSHCIVTIWENNHQVGMITRHNLNLGEGFETLEVLYEKHIPEHLMILFSLFGWELFVGVVDANRTITTIALNKQPFDSKWKPSE